MKKEYIRIGCGDGISIPAIIWGEPSECVFIYVHGKMSSKEYAEQLAEIADGYGIQTLSFDLPGHGERANLCSACRVEPCDVWHGLRDLEAVGEFADTRWERQWLFACSLGAYFSLHAYKERCFERCLFQSPIVDMEYLIGKMFEWSGTTPDELRERKFIATKIDTLSWDYYSWVLAHPVTSWDKPTSVLYAGRDILQSSEVIDDFCRRFKARLTVSPGSDHPFMEPGDASIIDSFIRSSI